VPVPKPTAKIKAKGLPPSLPSSFFLFLFRGTTKGRERKGKAERKIF
jgi:hypothetical protein